MSPSDRINARKQSGSYERRSLRRLPVGDATGQVVVEATINGSRATGQVVDLSEGGIRALFSGELRRPRLASEAEHAVLLVQGREPVPLSKLVVRGAVAEQGAIELTLVSDDPATRAALWYSMESFATEEKAAVPVPEAAPTLPRIPGRGQYDEAARLERLSWVKKQTGKSLTAMDTTRLHAERLSGNIENMIGAIEVPVGLAGPLLYAGQHAKGFIYAPFATTEGALVASATRGAAAISRSGGVTTRVLAQRMMRVPMFLLSNLEGAIFFASWLRDHIPELRNKVREVSRHANLVSVESTLVGRMVHVQFLYETADAAGQNMTTTCTWHACQWIMAQTRFFDEVKFENFAIESNVSGDKKVTFKNFINGRGIRVVADCVLRRETLAEVLKTTPEELMLNYARGMAGAISTGGVGFTVNAANVIAAMFAATGQDIACAHESALGQLHFEPVPEGLYATMVLPSLVIGTVGGGTHLPAQNAMLDLMGCAGARNVLRLAEIICGYALALDLSTLSAVSSGEFASAHERLGRNRPVDYFARKDLSPAFFEPALRELHEAPELRVRAIDEIETQLGSSILTELSARKVSKLVGLFPLRLLHDVPGATAPSTTDVLVKVKPLDEEIMLLANGMAAMCGPRLAMAHQRFKQRVGAAGSHLRELAIYEQTDPRFRAHMPRVLTTFRDDKREAYVIVMEKLEHLRLMDSADDPRGWSRRCVEAALTGIAQVHSVWLGREEELLAQPWIGTPPTAASMVEMSELWDALAVHAAQEFPELVGQAELDLMRGYIRTLEEWWPKLEQMPRTLIHNDFNPRNLALRDDTGLKLCAYDWELATLNVPQHDLAELLCFVLPPDVNRRNVDHLVEAHRKALEQASGRAIDKSEWRAGYALCLRDLAINRFSMYLMAHTFRYYKFMERTIKTLWRLLEIEASAGPAA